MNEADMLVNWLAKNERRPNWTRTEQGALIKYEGDEKRGQWLHIRSFVLAYTHIAVFEQLKCFLIENILRVCTDAIYTTTIPKTILDETVVEMGQELLPDFDKSLFTKAKNSAELEEVYAKYEAELDKKRKQYESVIVLETPEIKYGQ